MSESLGNFISQKLVDWGIIGEEFFRQFRYYCLVKYPSLKNVGIECNTKMLIVRIYLQFKWYHFYNRQSIMARVKKDIEIALPEGMKISSTGEPAMSPYTIEVFLWQKKK